MAGRLEVVWLFLCIIAFLLLAGSLAFLLVGLLAGYLERGSCVFSGFLILLWLDTTCDVPLRAVGAIVLSVLRLLRFWIDFRNPFWELFGPPMQA